MSVAVQRGPDTTRLYVKGASEIVLARCKSWINKDDGVTEFDQAKRTEVEYRIIGNFAHAAYRTITMAYKDIPTKDFLPEEWDEEYREE
jgi:Ca2+ transporting ATPase